MNREDIIRMAREAGIVFDDRAAPFYERLVHSAYAAGAAAEREALADEAEKNGNSILAMQIRARGQS